MKLCHILESIHNALSWKDNPDDVFLAMVDIEGDRWGQRQERERASSTEGNNENYYLTFYGAIEHLERVWAQCE